MESAYASTSALTLVNHQEMFDNMYSQCPPGQSRARISMACATCRQRKSKCDGVAPICGACRTKGRCCRYEPVSKLDSYKARLRKKQDRQRKSWERMVDEMVACGIEPPMGLTRVEPRRALPREEGLLGLGIELEPTWQAPSCLAPWQPLTMPMPTSSMSDYSLPTAPMISPATWSQTSTPPLTPSQSAYWTSSPSPSPSSDNDSCHSVEVDPFFLLPAPPVSNLMYAPSQAQMLHYIPSC